MIEGIKNKSLKRFYEDDDAKGIRPDWIERVREILTALDNATDVGDLAAIRTFRLHALKGDLKGHWSVTVHANWRIIFKFTNGVASDIDLVDYH